MRVRLMGVFEIRDADGTDCTPRGAKARALVAMLCQTADRRRTRRWLEARLWSDRGPEQASGSLRQVLMELRRAFGASADIIMADRDHVALGTVATDLEQDPGLMRAARQAGREFLEGIDIVDQAFLDWLRDERERVDDLLFPESATGETRSSATIRRPASDAPAILPIVLRPGGRTDGLGQFTVTALGDAVARLLAETVPVEVFGAGGAHLPNNLPPGGLDLGIEATQIGEHLHLLVRWTDSGAGPVLWHHRTSLPLAQADFLGAGDFAKLVFQTVEAALLTLATRPRTGSGPARAAALISEALTDMFSYDGTRLRQADASLARAHDAAPSARALAWRSLVRQIMYVERTERDRARLFAEADEFARTALEMPDTSPLVFALVSQVRVMLDSNPEAGAVLARDAVALSPYNPFGHAAQCGAMLRYARHDEALEAARTGAEISARTNLVHWWESLSGLAALSAGLHVDAIAHYEAAHYRAPSFRSPMRHLLFLYLAAGDDRKARRVLASLRRVEPDFSPDLIRRDPDYPAATLRRTGLIDRHIAALRDLMAN
jgi:tetratricopeptide (TPR) repeat protein